MKLVVEIDGTSVDGYALRVLEAAGPNSEGRGEVLAALERLIADLNMDQGVGGTQ